MPMTRPLKFLVFQHIACEHPGTFREYFAADGIEWDAVELDEGETIPELEAYDALWVMGGPMDTWQEDANPWLKTEKAAIRRAVVDLEMPYMGLCLGHQLLAEALGGKVGPAAEPEIGIMPVHLTDTGKTSPFLNGFPETLWCLQWHSAEVLEAPEGADILVSTPACPSPGNVIWAKGLFDPVSRGDRRDDRADVGRYPGIC